MKKNRILSFSGIGSLLLLLLFLTACMPTEEDRADYLEMKLNQKYGGKPAVNLLQEIPRDRLKVTQYPSGETAGFLFDYGKSLTVRVNLKKPAESSREDKNVNRRLIKEIQVFPRSRNDENRNKPAISK